MFISTSEYKNENMANYSYELKSKSTSQMTTHTPAASMKTAQAALASATTGTLSLEHLNEHFNMNVNENVSFTLPPTPTPLTFLFQNESTYDSNGTYMATPRISSEIPIWLIPCYGVIFFFAIFGNLLVISTLVQNRRMRNVTNVFLLNLAISDMLLGVLCMPVTLVGTLLRHFIFGEFFCKLIQFSQAASVAVSSWTLVAISCERYYAICHPLRSRTWQTINHAYRIIGFIWFGSIVCMTPIAVFSQLIPTSRQGLRKCRDQWPEDTIAYERFYNIFLDLALLVLPLFVLCVAYILITRTLYVGMRAERALIFGGNINSSTTTVKQHDDSSLGAIATVTKSATATTADATLHSPLLRRFNLKMSLRCHSSHGSQANIGSYDIRSNDQDVAAGAQSDTRYHQQQQQEQQQQLKYYDDPGNEAISHKSFSTAATKTAKTQKNLFGLRLLSCVDSSVAEQQMDLQQNKQREIRNSTTRGPRCYNNNGNKSEPSLFTLQPHRFQRHQQARLTLRANLSQHNSNQGQNFWKQTPLQLQQQYLIEERRKSDFSPTIRNSESTLRRSNEAKNLESKKRVVKMLFVLVLEFFICWTPLYVINTIVMFIGPAIYEYIDYTSICFFQLLAYSSSCCNPITYCFMNASFRRAFLDTFKGMRMSSGTSRRMSEVGFSSLVRRRRRVASDSNSVSCTQLPTLATNNSISLTNNKIFVPNNSTTTHNSPAPPQSN